MELEFLFDTWKSPESLNGLISGWYEIGCGSPDDESHAKSLASGTVKEIKPDSNYHLRNGLQYPADLGYRADCRCTEDPAYIEEFRREFSVRARANNIIDTLRSSRDHSRAVAEETERRTNWAEAMLVAYPKQCAAAYQRLIAVKETIPISQASN